MEKSAEPVHIKVQMLGEI